MNTIWHQCLECKTCNVPTPGFTQYHEHVLGKRHKQALKNSKHFFCEICRLYPSGDLNEIETHPRTQFHIDRYNLLAKMKSMKAKHFSCQLCDQTDLKSMAQYVEHFLSDSHGRKARRFKTCLFWCQLCMTWHDENLDWIRRHFSSMASSSRSEGPRKPRNAEDGSLELSRRRERHKDRNDKSEFRKGWRSYSSRGSEGSSNKLDKKCQFCNRSYDANELFRHQVRRHRDSLFSCLLCPDLYYTSIAGLMKHFTQHCNIKSQLKLAIPNNLLYYTCFLCEPVRKFSWDIKGEARKHMKARHREEWMELEQSLPCQCRLCNRKFRHDNLFMEHPCSKAFEPRNLVDLDLVKEIMDDNIKEVKLLE